MVAYVGEAIDGVWVVYGILISKVILIYYLM